MNYLNHLLKDKIQCKVPNFKPSSSAVFSFSKNTKWPTLDPLAGQRFDTLHPKLGASNYLVPGQHVA